MYLPWLGVHCFLMSNAYRIEIERITQIGITFPKRLMTISMDAMDNQKVNCINFDSNLQFKEFYQFFRKL